MTGAALVPSPANRFAESPARSLPLPRAVYVHVPFCAHHCGYCDFAVVSGHDHHADLYLEALTAEMAQIGSTHRVDTIFLGGGTPTHLQPGQLARLLATVTQWFPGAGEFSIEATPDSLTDAKIAVLAEFGVNRVSIGAQSFHADTLRFLERTHAAADIAQAVGSVRRRIGQVSLDLIFGVPGQALADFEDDLNRAIELAPDHVSAYGLTFEPGTPLGKRHARGDVTELPEDGQRAMFLLAEDRLTAAGYPRYELSNFARPGRRCRHNETYWANEPYFGFGLGAAAYVNGRRTVNTRNLADYLRKTLSGESATVDAEELTPIDRARETLTLNMRRVEGVCRHDFRDRTDFDLDAVAGPAIARLSGIGVISDDGDRVRLTRDGRCVADAVMAELWAGR